MERPDIPRNFRDLGGLAGAGGKYIRPGKLWRSGQLYGASEGDLIWLRVHGLTAIADLRSVDEQKNFPDAVPENATFRSFPLIERETREPGLTGLIKLLRKEGRSGEEYLVDYYGSLVRDPHAADELRMFFDLLLTQDGGAILWHCTAGKDRTGITTALVLAALGVSREDIMTDYLRTNDLSRKHIESTEVEMLSLLGRGADTMSREITQARPAYLNAMFESLAALGGTERYLAEVLGLDDEKLARLRRLYLEE